LRECRPRNCGGNHDQHQCDERTLHYVFPVAAQFCRPVQNK
jgi:hypothetical protein